VKVSAYAQIGKEIARAADVAQMKVGRLLCRDEAERRRITDVGRALRPGMPWLLACFIIAGLSGIWTYGWAPLLPPLVAIAVYAVTWSLNMPRRTRPEYAYAAAFVFAELMLAAAIVLARGPRTPYLILLVMPVLFIAVLLPKRAAVAAAVFGGVLILTLALTVGYSEVAVAPSRSYTPVFIVVSLVFTALALRDLDDESRRSAFVDELTHALNRAALAPRLAELSHQAADTGKPVAVILADIDHFKLVNDEHGHVTGDRALREVVRRISDCVGAFEPVYRLGGEEFLILLPGLHTEAAREVALSMWHAVRDTPIAGIRVTVSFGVASSEGTNAFDFDSLFAAADRALYAAKQGGRDWVRVASDLSNGASDALEAGAGAEMTPARSVADAATDVPAQDEGARTGSPLDGARPSLELVGWTQASSPQGTGPTRVTDDLEREHILDLNRRLGTMFRIISAGAWVLIATSIPRYGWHPLIAPMIGAVPYALLSRHAGHFRSPGRALTAGWVLFQASIAVGFLCSSGAPLFALPLIILMVPGRCAVLRPRAAAAATAYTGVLMIGVSFALDSAAVLHAPSVLLFQLALLVEAGYVGSIVGRSAVGHRGAGVVDELTGLLNRTALRARVLELTAHQATAPRRVGMLLIDVDHFKQINDRDGHAAGDVVLREAGERIRGALRTYESAYRVGGEEVLVLLPNADVGSATEVAERLRAAVGGTPCGGVPVTISVGVGLTAPGEPFVYRDVFQRADTALYEAKRKGRDRVCAHSPLPPLGPIARRADSDHLQDGPVSRLSPA
jgi:diguanylate cyclase (GGDEF)-like protein